MTLTAGRQHVCVHAQMHECSWSRVAACHAGTFCSVLGCQARCQLSKLFSMPYLNMTCGDKQSVVCVHLWPMACRRYL